jgi:beta-lactamase class D
MMKKIIFLCLGLLYCSHAWAEETCFLAKENQTVLKREGKDCKKRYSPESSFKIALSLMGYDSGILEDETHPVWQFKEDHKFS